MRSCHTELLPGQHIIAAGWRGSRNSLRETTGGRASEKKGIASLVRRWGLGNYHESIPVCLLTSGGGVLIYPLWFNGS